MAFLERAIIAELDTGHVVFVFRWRCTCLTSSCWLLDESAASHLAADHAASHVS